MQESLIVFRKNNFFFGIKPSDFDYQFNLNKVFISKENLTEGVWRFENADSELKKGVFVHLGALFNLYPAFIQHNNFVFCKQVEKDFYLGYVFDNFYTQIALKKFKNKKKDLQEIHNLPPDIPREAFQYIQLFKRKKILVVDPIGLYLTYQDQLKKYLSIRIKKEIKEN
ncbi:MAG: hypothetical protein OEY59_04830 [Deltaproteobacteria bacterium]|nr:hypothetical protein [Deltaproteobacteria bacterium]